MITSIFPSNGYQIIFDIDALESWIAMIRSVGMVAINTRTDSLNALTSNLLGLCFSVQSDTVAYLPLDHIHLDTLNHLDQVRALAAIKPVLEDHSIAKIGHNLKFKHRVLKRYNIELNGIIFDTMLESYVLNSTAGHHDINSLVTRFLQNNNVSIKNTSSTGQNQSSLDSIALCASESNASLLLHQLLWPQLKQILGLKKVFQEIEMPLVPVLSRIEYAGVLIDKNIFSKHSVEINIRLEKLEKRAYSLAKETFNLSSTKQLQIILFDKQKLPILKKTPRGAPSTNEDVLSLLALNYPLPKLILEYRYLTKLKSNYVDKLPQMVNMVSKRLHTSYHQAVTATGRLSSSNPNLQNIPIRNNDGHRIRQAFIAPPDALIISADYSQIELRIMAHLSNDIRLINALKTGEDIHKSTAAEIFSLPLEKITKNMRNRAKIINFALIYGISAFSLARQLLISHFQAQEYINLYFKRYPGILDYMERTRKKVANQGYVTTIDGRRLYLPNIYSHNLMLKRSAERAAINATIQGTAADIIKRAMIVIDNWIQQESIAAHMIMQVHDELVFEVKRDAVKNAKAQIKILMEGCFKLDVPLVVDIGVGENWDQAH